jgi:hypothetical protein
VSRARYGRAFSPNKQKRRRWPSFLFIPGRSAAARPVARETGSETISTPAFLPRPAHAFRHRAPLAQRLDLRPETFSAQGPALVRAVAYFRQIPAIDR